ncbi:hypothetical protein ASPCADRAFT_178619 [Aspergillus carbonarius ITEM 5010]|uniref:C2H2-type domain-containing protein n=1 Tax=Aspergillus carbonarius (strain ITEM 5010) TaxID=602072 RepID=A0A1R3R867_ASPC5|nr:hypothetical protein ASPCADRAFT_178619 [Aspergillus carbonarius ITEM 5010]
MSPSRSSQHRFRCRVTGCTSSFQRKEHRTRHESQHTGALARVCPLCARTFSRSDSLRRHIRLDHANSQASSTTETTWPTRTSQACRRCRLAKTRCGGGTPCDRCRDQPDYCIYNDPQIQQQQQQRDEHDAQTQMEQPQQQDQSLPGTTIGPDPTAQFTSYIHLYFTHFHPHWPILHRATFSPPDEPLLLLQVVSMIGLWVSDKPSAQEAAVSLHQKVGSSILAQQENWAYTLPFDADTYNAKNYNEDQQQKLVSHCPVATYQAILLYLIFSLVLTNSRPRALDLSLALAPPDRHILSVLVETCRRNRLFYYPRMLERYHRTITSVPCIWVGVEELKRLGLAMYKVSRLCGGQLEDEDDSKVLRLSDLQFAFPDSRRLWEAPSNSELSRLLQIEATQRRGGCRVQLDSRDEGNWISTCGRLLDGVESWWL